MRIFFRLAFIVVITNCFSVVMAQYPQMNLKVVGKVYESTEDKPVEYVNVAVFSVRDSTLVSGSITSADGSFSIPVNRPGKFYLVADFIGSEKSIISDILLKPGAETFDAGVIKINPAVVGLDEVEVIGDKPYVSYQIDKKVVEVSLNPAAQGGTAVDALQNVPSVQTDIEGNVSIRGNANFTVLIDGRQSPLTGSDALKQIPASAIDKIEIITNPSVKYDPDGTAGIVNIISKKGKLNGHSAVINLSAGTSPMYSGDINYSYRLNRLTLNAGVNYRNFGNTFYNESEKKNVYIDLSGNDSILKILEDGEGNMSMENISGKLSADYQITKSNTFSIGGEYSLFSHDRENGSEITRVDSENGEQYQVSSSESGNEAENAQFKIGNRQIFGDKPEHFLTIDFLAEKRNGDNDNSVGRFASDFQWVKFLPADLDLMSLVKSNENRYRLETNYSNPISKNLSFETGYTLRIDLSDQSYSQFEKNESNSWFQNTEFDDNADFSRYINAGWAIIKGEFKTINYSIGLRGEMTNQLIETKKDTLKFTYDYLGWYPSLSFSREFNGGHELQASYSKRINRPWDRMLSPFPALSDGYSVFQPNPKLEPEYAGAYEINYQKSWGPSFLSVETFYRKTDNKMERLFIPVNDTLNVFTVQNIGKDLSIGAEIMANIKISPWLILNSTASMYYYELQGELDGVDSIVGNNNYEASVTFNFNLPTKTRIMLSGQYEGPEVELDGKEDAVYWMSASARQDFFDRKLSATLRVDDVLSSRRNKQNSQFDHTFIYSERYRKSPMFVLSLSYKFNQQNGDKKRNVRPEDMNGGEGGMDMEY